MLQARANRGFYLAISTTVILGLGLWNKLPLHTMSAAYAVEQSNSNKSQQLSLAEANGSKAKGQEKKVSASGWTLEKLFEVFSSSKDLDDSTLAVGEISDTEDDDPIALLVVIVAFCSFLLGLLPQLLPDDSDTGSSGGVPKHESLRANNPVVPNNSPPTEDDRPNSGEKPQQVPTPALLPGLLAMGLKAFRKQQVAS